MKITRIHIDEFGNWNDLNLAPFNAGVNVFYGPNETGKSTLMRMIRSVLYGFQTEGIREQSRVPDSTHWSALLDIKHKGQVYEIRRQTNSRDRGHFSFQGETRGLSNQDLLASLHAGVNESVFENVFAIGLNELQELGTLHGDQVAQHIYGLSLGPEGQAILDASSEVVRSRQQLLSPDFKTGKLVDLYQKLDDVNAKLADLEQQTQRFFSLSDDLQMLCTESDSLKKRREGLQYQIRGHRFLDRIWKPWQEVQTLHQKLRQLPVVNDFPEDGVALLNDYDRELKQIKEKLTELKVDLKRVSAEAEQNKIDNDLLNFAPNIQSLVDQKNWIIDLERQYKAGETRARDAELTLQKYLGPNQTLDEISHIKTTPDNNQRLIDAAHQYRIALRKRKNTHQRYKKVSRKYQQTLAHLQEQSNRLLNGHSIDEELQKARERMKHLERLSQLRMRESECIIRQEAVKEQLARLQTHSRIPSWAKKTLFGFALAGILLLIAGAWRGVTDVIYIGLIYCLTGLFLGGTTWAIKKHFEVDVDDQVEDLQDKSWALDVHLRETRQEIERLLEDEYFSLKLITEGHSLTTDRYRENIPELNFNDENILRADLLHGLALKIGELEQLKVAQEQTQKTRQLLVKLRNRSQEIQREFSSKRHEWCECLKELGLTETLKINEAFQMWQHVSNVHLHADQFQQEKKRIQPLGEIINAYSSRVHDLGQRMGRNQHEFDKPFEVVSQWESEIETFAEHQKELTRLRKEEQKISQESDVLELKLEELNHKCSRLLIRGGAANRDEFIQRAVSLEERIQLESVLEDAQAELEKASRSENELAIVEEDLMDFNSDENAEHLEMLNLELEDIESDLVTTAENMGRLKQDYQNAKNDRSSAHLRFEREQILEQIRQASEKWFSAEASSVGLSKLRSEYERNCQPETLAIASEYLSQLTNGKYKNIWTPLGEQFPKIDDQQGQTLTVSKLSSGTREQLFLAIRLAMVERFRNNGVELPMILDDVLVNFDQSRTVAAIETLNTVAKKGQQFLLFTCHLHLARLFEEHGCPPVRLPDSSSQSANSPNQFPPQNDETEQKKERESLLGRRDYRRDHSHASSTVHSQLIPPFYLDRSMPVEEAPSIGVKTANRLGKIDILTVNDFLECNPEVVSKKLKVSHINQNTIREWKKQAKLACCIPGLRGHDAQILVSCGFFEPETIAHTSPQVLFGRVKSFIKTNAGRRIIRNGKKPNFKEVSNWILWAQKARELKAA
ncbi:DUF4332 domain-containing protein [Gimesia aquarii]|uniref:Chromosome segregation protein n=1 Tax=Gimesia aquarii TaxID=2527964 RepID=A0A517WP27_9PLAN|nr:DUF4332 domain-containing protein [Gimesia aquarii]QDU07010.1 chromosome segregation protein [Gimesia aquarii]